MREGSRLVVWYLPLPGWDSDAPFRYYLDISFFAFYDNDDGAKINGVIR